MENKKSKPYKELCLKDKIEVINFLKNNSQRAAAKKFQVSKTCVNNIFKRRLEYLKRFEDKEDETRCRKIKEKYYFKVNEATYVWFKRMCAMNARVSGPMIQQAALEFSKILNVENFTASNSWLESFKKKHNILCYELKSKEIMTNISGPYSSGAKLKNVDPNQPSTSTQEGIFPDVGSPQSSTSTQLANTGLGFDSNIIIKQEIIETEVDPSAIYDPSSFACSSVEFGTIKTPEGLPGTITPETHNVKAPQNIPMDVHMDNLNTSENPTSITHTEVPIVKIKESGSVVPVNAAKHHKKVEFRKMFVKKGGKRSPDPSDSSSDEDGDRRRSKDKFDVYAESIASELRDLDARSCAFVQSAIADLIFEAKLGRFLSDGDKSIFSAKKLDILKNMPSPCENVS